MVVAESDVAVVAVVVLPVVGLVAENVAVAPVVAAEAAFVVNVGTVVAAAVVAAAMAPEKWPSAVHCC